MTICTAGQDGDSPMFVPLMDQVKIGHRTRPDAARGDEAYSSQAIRTYLRETTR